MSEDSEVRSRRSGTVVPPESYSLSHGCGGSVCGTGPQARWACSYHMTWNGQDLHVGAARDCIVGVSLRADKNTYINFVDNGKPRQDQAALAQWEDVEAALMRDPRFWNPPTDEEVEAAAQAALRLLQEMEA